MSTIVEYETVDLCSVRFVGSSKLYLGIQVKHFIVDWIPDYKSISLECCNVMKSNEKKKVKMLEFVGTRNDSYKNYEFFLVLKIQ